MRDKNKYIFLFKASALICGSFYLFLFLFLFPVSAEMKSSSYIIYENLFQTFDGPVLSSPGVSVSENIATISWNTDVLASSFVVYDTESSFVNNYESGNSNDSTLTHEVILSGLEYSTTYYYRVKSRSINGGESIGGVLNFSTGAAPEEPRRSSGGSILIIDKTDKIAPSISDISIDQISSESAYVSWLTDEDASAFIEYGVSEDYGKTVGSWEMGLEHEVILENLLPGVEYYFRILSSDDSGNVGESENQIFTTQKGDEIAIDTDNDGIVDEIISEDDLKTLLQKAVEIMNNMAGEVSAEINESDLLDPFDSLKKLASFIPAPLFSAEPRLEIESDKVTVFWKTDKNASSLVAISSEELYFPNATESYSQIVGDSENLIKDHRVEVFGLKPDTLYHYQLRSKAILGPLGRSRDFTFRTAAKSIEISNFFSQVIDDNTAIFKWLTNVKADSVIVYTPYRDNELFLDESRQFNSEDKTVLHEITISNFSPGVKYKVEIESNDESGNKAVEIIDPFSTAEDDLSPEVTQIKTSSSISSDKQSKIQTVISWVTNEPATTQVFFMEGVHGTEVQLKDNSPYNGYYAKEHIVVVNKFNPGTVYTFRVESVDSGGNKTTSDPQTFMTPKKSESIIDVIIRVLEDTFGWMKEII